MLTNDQKSGYLRLRSLVEQIEVCPEQAPILGQQIKATIDVYFPSSVPDHRPSDAIAPELEPEPSHDLAPVSADEEIPS